MEWEQALSSGFRVCRGLFSDQSCPPSSPRPGTSSWLPPWPSLPPLGVLTSVHKQKPGSQAGSAGRGRGVARGS